MDFNPTNILILWITIACVPMNVHWKCIATPMCVYVVKHTKQKKTKLNVLKLADNVCLILEFDRFSSLFKHNIPEVEILIAFLCLCRIEKCYPMQSPFQSSLISLAKWFYVFGIFGEKFMFWKFVVSVTLVENNFLR